MIILRNPKNGNEKKKTLKYQGFHTFIMVEVSGIEPLASKMRI